MAPETLAEAERLILRGDDLDAVCDALGCTRRTLERAFKDAHGTTPARWRRAQRGAGGATGGGASPVVAFRLAEYAALAEAAKVDGCSPSEWAKLAVQLALASRHRVAR